jgi:hypothetical protein
MELMVLDDNLEAIYMIDTYSSFLWTDRYYQYGDFEFYSSMNPDILAFLKQDYYIWNRNSDHTMIIEKHSITSDVENGSFVTVTGRSLESILDRRIIWGQKMLSGNLQNGIEELINENIINPTDSLRQIPNFIFEPTDDSSITELTIDAQYTGDNLYSVIQKICEEHDLGFKVTINHIKQFVFKLYRGIDRSFAQTSVPYVIFSPNFDNIINSNYVESSEKYKNVTLVGGEGDGASRKYATVGDTSGLDRRELFTDARDISSDVGNHKVLSTEEYKAVLIQRGTETLADNANSIIKAFEGKIETDTLFRYGVDFFNGDIVQIANEYGHEGRVRIIEIVMSEDGTGSSVYPTYKTVEKKVS